MIESYDIYQVIRDAREGSCGRILPPSLQEILARYERRQKVEVFLFLLPLPLRRLFPREKWWLDTVNLWYRYHEEQGLDFARNFNFLVEKNKQYGSTQLYRMDTLGLWLRSFDKVERIRTIDGGVKTDLLKNESRKDSLLDLFNYSILAVLVMRRKIT